MAETKTPTTGDLVRGKRATARLSQADVARFAGLSPRAFARREAGEVEFTASELSAIARGLGVPVADLYPIEETVPRTVVRDSSTGRFTEPEEAESRPTETTTEIVGRIPKAKGGES